MSVMFARILVFCVSAGLLAACSNAVREGGESVAPDLDGACDRALDYDLDFDRFDEVAQQIAHATGCFIEVDDMAAAGKVRPNAVQGHMTPREAVYVAIEGTALSVVENEPDRIAVGKR
ncbi:hypothetical protein ACEZHJ_14355 [Arhodomonas sp. KWT2]